MSEPTQMWMQHKEHGGIAWLPDMPYWRNLGWEPSDTPPPEPDLTRDPEPAPPAEATTRSASQEKAEE